MILPRQIFTVAIWLAYAGVGAGAIYLLVMLVRDLWKKRIW